MIVSTRLLLRFVERYNLAREGYARAKEAEEQAKRYHQEYYEQMERELAARLVAAVRGQAN